MRVKQIQKACSVLRLHECVCHTPRVAADECRKTRGGFIMRKPIWDLVKECVRHFNGLTLVCAPLMSEWWGLHPVPACLSWYTSPSFPPFSGTMCCAVKQPAPCLLSIFRLIPIAYSPSTHICIFVVCVSRFNKLPITQHNTVPAVSHGWTKNKTERGNQVFVDCNCLHDNSHFPIVLLFPTVAPFNIPCPDDPTFTLREMQRQLKTRSRSTSRARVIASRQPLLADTWSVYMHLCLLIFVCFEVRVRAGKIGPLTACTEVRAARILNSEACVSAPVCLHQVVTLTAPARTHTDTYKGCEYRKVFSDERLTPPPSHTPLQYANTHWLGANRRFLLLSAVLGGKNRLLAIKFLFISREWHKKVSSKNETKCSVRGNHQPYLNVIHLNLLNIFYFQAVSVQVRLMGTIAQTFLSRRELSASNVSE